MDYELRFPVNKIQFRSFKQAPDRAGQRGPNMLDITSTSEWRGSPDT